MFRLGGLDWHTRQYDAELLAHAASSRALHIGVTGSVPATARAQSWHSWLDAPARHTVCARHTRSLVGVGAAAWYWLTVHAVRLPHTRSLLAVGAEP